MSLNQTARLKPFLEPGWIVVTDFDGTLTEKDVGNELCDEVLGQRFHEIHGRYRSGELGLKEMQKELWERFPLEESRFRERARHYGKLRPGVDDFFKLCKQRKIPVFVASCGIRAYIEEVLESQLSAEAHSAIRELRCNECTFDVSGISEFIPPAKQDKACPYPLDKGAWTTQLKSSGGVRALGIGNGTSDRSLHGHVDRLAATEGFAKWCLEQRVDYIPFHDFRDLLPLFPERY